METVATTKGQVVIPASLRRKHGIKSGTRIQVLEEGGRIVLVPITPAYVKKVKGMFKGSGAMKVLIEEKKRDRELEDAKAR